MLVLLLAVCAIAKAQHADSTNSPKLVWRFVSTQPFVASPVVDSGLLYVGGLDSMLYCIVADRGTIKWKRSVHGEVRSRVALGKKTLYCVSGDGNLYAISRADGAVVWTFHTRGEKKYSPFAFADYFFSAPVPDGDIVYFGSGDGSVYAVNRVTGQLVWKFVTGDVVHSTPSIAGDNLYIGSFDGFVYCLNKRSGRLIWKFKSVGQEYFPKGEMNGSPLAAGNNVYIGGRDYNFYALDAARGYCHWNLRFQKGWAITPPVLHDSALFIGTSDDHLFLRIDPYSGKEVWRADLHYNIFAAPAITDSSLVVGTMMGKLFQVDPGTGSVGWQFVTDGNRKHGGKYFLPDDRYRPDIDRIITRNEDFLQLYMLTGAIISQPAWDGRRLYVSSMDGTLYCLEPPAL